MLIGAQIEISPYLDKAIITNTLARGIGKEIAKAIENGIYKVETYTDNFTGKQIARIVLEIEQ